MAEPSVELDLLLCPPFPEIPYRNNVAYHLARKNPLLPIARNAIAFCPDAFHYHQGLVA
jgi:hypothetical protein